MGGLIELVFEGVARSQAHGLLTAIAGASEGDPLITVDGTDLPIPGSLHSALEEMQDWLFVRWSALRLPGIQPVPAPGLRIIACDGHLDVELNFDEDDIRDLASFSRALHGFAAWLASETGVVEYYAGFEPATDTTTRLFTREQPGPMFVPP